MLAPEQIIAIVLIPLILWNIGRRRREVRSWLKDDPTETRPWWKG